MGDPEKTSSGNEHGLQNQDAQDYSVFSPALRTYLTYLLGFIMILSTLTATIYFPLIPMLSTEFSVSIQHINLTVTVYTIFQAVSPALFASFADTFGRRPVILGLIVLYSCASLGLALNRKSYTALILLRALQSIGGSAIPPIAYGIVADLTVVAQRGKMLGPMLSTCNAISAVGPVIGGAVALGTGGVTWVFLTLLVIAIICILLAGFTLPETARCIVGNGSKPTTGIWRTWWSLFQRRRLQEHSESETDGAAERPSPYSSNQSRPLMRAFASFRIILYPDAAAVLWMVASSYSVYYTFQVAIPVIFQEIYQYNELEIGLTFLPGLAGMTIGGIIAGKLLDRNFATTAREFNIDVDVMTGNSLIDFPIEIARYRKCLVFVLLELILVVGYGWAVYFHVHPSVPIIMQFFICGLSTLLSHTASALLVDIFPDDKSSTAYASGQIIRCGLSAASAAALQPLIDAVGRGWYFTIFSLFIGISGILTVVISRLRGIQWRQKRCASCNKSLGGEQVREQPLVTQVLNRDETNGRSK